ncbi:pachytene checkpoint protein 2 homolog [Xenia sp. Carnegie-2017]|uniref:pachytene checkpoint protein 2 homolog n=1 Tax=Xenia sp. Carnegie-2017 TaxID=2897299 RepID=UPI001F04788A|nr:pachytene checkpoint protein 2 homolog [Xenia sp. Carnegie-2017]XP_046849620.1 pachytene checkpoint protein 2 homolog [Xenia sp. Carnegie-2017]
MLFSSYFRHPNVIILTTSNITRAIDVAFVDRADIKQYIGPPSAKAINKIYHSCIKELARTSIISPATQILDLSFVDNDVTHCSLELKKIAEKSYQLSGRTLRKLPFLAHALYSKAQTITSEEFLNNLSMIVDKQFKEKENLCSVGEEKSVQA